MKKLHSKRQPENPPLETKKSLKKELKILYQTHLNLMSSILSIIRSADELTDRPDTKKSNKIEELS